MIEIDELYERQLILQEKIDNFFDGDDDPHYGDRGYQELLEQLEEVEIEIGESYE